VPVPGREANEYVPGEGGGSAADDEEEEEEEPAVVLRAEKREGERKERLELERAKPPLIDPACVVGRGGVAVALPGWKSALRSSPGARAAEPVVKRR
jgi:hypothetical protein